MIVDYMTRSIGFIPKPARQPASQLYNKPPTGPPAKPPSRPARTAGQAGRAGPNSQRRGRSNPDVVLFAVVGNGPSMELKVLDAS